MKDIILAGIAFFCAVGVILFSCLFCALAVSMQKEEGAGSRP